MLIHRLIPFLIIPFPSTMPTVKSHTHPIFCMDVVGTQNAHNLISVSTDGKLCSWNLDMLKEPVESFDLQAGNKSVAATCMSFPSADTGTTALTRTVPLHTPD
jgi:dynein intermediate chain